MQVIFGGKFEIALIRSVDAVLQPQRNASTHPYYAGLNRYVARNYFERCGTFLALAEGTLVPTVDWNYPIDRKYRGVLTDVELGVESTSAGGSEWDNSTRKFVTTVLKSQALSPESLNHISALSFSHYAPADRQSLRARFAEVQNTVADHYLNRLFLQLKAARETRGYLVLGEEDIRIIEEVVNWLAEVRPHAPFELPDLRGKLIEPESFAEGLLNFSPPDLQAVSAVRANSTIRSYARRVADCLAQDHSVERERRMLSAMVDAYKKSEASARAEKIFEIASWIVKPLHYVPGIDAALTIAEDVKDVGMKIYKRDEVGQDWYLIAAKMSDIAIRDYIERKSNLLGST